MEELLAIKSCILEGQIEQALTLIDELEEMSRKSDKRETHSYFVVLITHIIKHHIEQRMTRSWAVSINNSRREIRGLAELDSTKPYFTLEEMQDTALSAFDGGLRKAQLEVFEGSKTLRELESALDANEIVAEAISIVYSIEPLKTNSI